MKNKLRIKNIFLVAFLFVFTLSLDLSGILNGRNKRVFAEAAERTYTVSDFFTLDEGVTMTETKTIGTGNTAVDKYDTFPEGSVIISDKPYKGEIVPTFKNNASIIFKFMDPNRNGGYAQKSFGGDNNGEFKFYFTDLQDSSNYFIIHYLSDGTAQVEYPTDEGLQVARTIGLNAKFNNDTPVANFIDLTWVGDELSVILAFGAWHNSLKTLATFGQNGLPKISFPNGYKISFSSDWETGTDIAFKTVLGKTIRDTSKTPADFTPEVDEATQKDKEYKAEDHIESTWRFYDPDLHFMEESVVFPASATEVITYNGIEMTNGCAMTVSQYGEIDNFYSAWKYDGMYFPIEKLTVNGTLDTTVVGNTATVSVTKGETTHSYNFTVTEITNPSLRLLGAKPTDGYVNQIIALPTATSDEGNTIKVSYTVGKDEKVDIENFTLIPQKVGVHKITYTATNRNNVAISETFEIIVVTDTEKPVLFVDYEDQFVAKGTTVKIPEATATDNADKTVDVVPTVTFGGQGVAITSNRFKVDNVGEYELILTATDRVGNSTFAKYKINVLPAEDFINITQSRFVSVENANVQEAGSSSKSFKGLSITSTTAYDGKFNVLFEGNKSLIFKFHEMTATPQDYSAERGDGDFYFKVANAENPEDYFTVHYEGTGTDVCVYVVYKGQKRYCNSSFFPIAGTVGVKGEGYTSSDFAGFNSGYNDLYNQLNFEWNNGILSVLNSQFKAGIETKVTIAKFDGTGKLAENSYKLPKLNWEAYTISFGSNYQTSTDGDEGTDVLFGGFKGEKTFFENAMLNIPVNKEALLYNGNVLADNSTIKLLPEENLGTFQSIGIFNGFSLAIKELNLDTAYDTTRENQNIEITLLGKTFHYQVVKVLDAKNPVIQLHNSVSSTTIIEKNSSYTISVADVIAYDDSCGKMQDSAISISIKKESGSEFIPYTNTYSFAETGNYIVRYTAIDGSGNSDYIDRTIVVIDSFIGQIVVNGNIEKVGYLYHTVKIPTATFNGENVQYNVVFNGKVLEIQNNDLVFDNVGQYTISYFTEDLKAQKIFYITVEKDTVLPEIYVDFAYKEVLKGSVVTLPTASAIDNVDGELTVTYKVMLGSEEIQVTDNKFTANVLGGYIVTYTTKDLTGNVSEKTFIVQCQEKLTDKVEEQPNGGSNAGNNNASNNGNADSDPSQSVSVGCAGSLNGSIVSMMFACLVAMLIKIKIKNKEN